MRSPLDRLRHAISFEIIGLSLLTPLGALVFAVPLKDMGVVGLVGATLATLWNYLYNWGFDHALQRLTGTTRKTLATRFVHALLFEAGLLAALLPFIAWYLGMNLWAALLMDLGFAGFYLVYAFAFNWAYDRLFPLPEWQLAEEAPHASRVPASR
ncbi:PACE efflux transporter [Pararhodobacter sp.]|uniref:PACE efflux transporter n=1 Tax=Pararhodobacter sp. TaxID=2127056 RepID=UPI002FDCA0BE